MYVLTNGENYVMENPHKEGDYASTTFADKAKEFTYKSAKKLLQNKKKSLAWIRSYYMLDRESGKKVSSNYYGNEGAYIGSNDFSLDENIMCDISNEVSGILGLAGWSITQLKTLREQLEVGLSKYDSAESDIVHALQKYIEDNSGKKPQAHKMSKVGYVLDDIRDKRKRIKESMRYVQVMESAAVNGYSLEKLKLELTKVKDKEYKGRTEYYAMVLDLLG